MIDSLGHGVGVQGASWDHTHVLILAGDPEPVVGSNRAGYGHQLVPEFTHQLEGVPTETLLAAEEESQGAHDRLAPVYLKPCTARK